MKTSKRFHKNLILPSIRGLERKVEMLLKSLTASEGFLNLPRVLLRDLKLVMIEGITNAIRHGSDDLNHSVKVRLIADPKKIEIQIHDWGKGFQLSKALKFQPDDENIHGRGLWILRNLVDSVAYHRGRPNRLILIRKLARSKKIDAAIELFDQLHEAIRQLKPKKFLYDEFIDFIVDMFNVERASFLIFEPEEERLKVAVSRGIAPKVAAKVAVVPGQGIAGYVFQTGRPLWVQNLSRMKKDAPRPRKLGYRTSSFVSVPVIASPLHIGEETLGVLNLTDKRDGSPFTQEELKLLNLMAQQAAGAFRIRDLIETIKYHEGLNKEFEIVREIQNRLLPTHFPQVGDLAVGGHCQLSVRGGGDYYDLIKVDGSLRGIIADVSGHHVGSAITMAGFRSVFRSIIYDPNTPGKVLLALRWAMHHDLLNLHQFISCWVFEYQPSGKLTISGAGHPPLLHYQRQTKTWQSYPAQHLLLGLEDELEPQNDQIILNPGDILFPYTDGLFDPKMRVSGFDKEKFCQLVETNAQLEPQPLVDKIMAEVTPHYQALRSPDDIAILALKRKG